jgi:phosphate transport system protein
MPIKPIWTPNKDREILLLREKLLAMSGQAERSVQAAVQALINRDEELANQVKLQDEIIDDYEKELDDMAITFLALKAPHATDLRLITCAMKISQNIERVGDEATTIARRAIELSKEPPLKEYVDIPRMESLVMDMLKDALDAFVNGDTQQARDLIQRDKQVDAINQQLHRELISYMIESSDNVTRCLHLMVVSKSLERIADHAKNIAEEVVFLFDATDIRHSFTSDKVTY